MIILPYINSTVSVSCTELAMAQPQHVFIIFVATAVALAVEFRLQILCLFVSKMVMMTFVDLFSVLHSLLFPGLELLLEKFP